MARGREGEVSACAGQAKGAERLTYRAVVASTLCRADWVLMVVRTVICCASCWAAAGIGGTMGRIA